MTNPAKPEQRELIEGIRWLVNHPECKQILTQLEHDEPGILQKVLDKLNSVKEIHQHPLPPKMPSSTLKAIEKEMDAFLTDALDPDYCIRERLHIILSEAQGATDVIQDTPAQQRIADAVTRLESLKETTVPTKQILTFDEAIALLREEQP